MSLNFQFSIRTLHCLKHVAYICIYLCIFIFTTLTFQANSVPESGWISNSVTAHLFDIVLRTLVPLSVNAEPCARCTNSNKVWELCAAYCACFQTRKGFAWLCIWLWWVDKILIPLAISCQNDRWSCSWFHGPWFCFKMLWYDLLAGSPSPNVSPV